MPRIRGRRPGTYVTDGGTSYRTEVDRDRYAVASFGWTPAAATVNPIPRGFTPRHVTGLSPTTGRRGTATVPSVTATIWTGVVTTFDVEADDATIDTMDVVNRIAEKPSLS